jgi:hypothetical protein
MSLKEKLPEIFLRYGLSEEEFLIYSVYLGLPQATVGEVANILEKEEEAVEQLQKITDKLVELKFLKVVPGVINRYIPLEPYFELYVKESQTFRDEISTIKDNVLADQSKRFEKLEAIENGAVGEVDKAVANQVNDFFKDSDAHDVDKKSVITAADKRFTETSKSLENFIQTTTFAARDRFTETGKGLEKDLQTGLFKARDRFTQTGKTLENDVQAGLFKARDRFTNTGKGLEKDLQGGLFKARDRYESTSKALEKDLHTHVDDNYGKFKTELNARDTSSKAVWDKNSAKFTGDNNQLNTDLDGITAAHNSQSKALEANLHKMTDDLNAALKSIADGFKSQYDGGIQEQKGTLNKIIDDLLEDVANRLAKLETECKKDLDAHVDHHKENADGLKPRLDEILEKYIKRMKNVVEELKKNISKLLLEQMDHVNETTSKLRNQLNERVEARQNQLVNQVQTFEKNTVILIDNLKDISDKLSELSVILSSRGSAWKALFLGRHKMWLERYEEIAERVSKISGSMKDDFQNSTAGYVKETKETTGSLQGEINQITSDENEGLKSATTALDKKQKEVITAELEGLAGDLSKEVDGTIQHNIKHCQDTTVKLKDSLENTLHTHKQDYDVAVNRHRQNGLKHYDGCNADVKKNVDSWYGNMDREHQRIKADASAEVANQIRDTNDHLKKTKDKNVTHSKEFERDVKEVETNQRNIFDELLRVIQDDFKQCKTNISEKINNEINLIKDETRQMDDLQHQKIDAEIDLFKNEVKEMDDLQHQKIDAEIDLFKNEVKEMDDLQHQKIDAEINLFKDEIAKVDSEQHRSIDEQIALFHSECETMENKLHVLLEDHKARYQDNAQNLQASLTKTVKDNIQNVKDAIADFTLNFMNSIDEGLEKAETNEEKLTGIMTAAAAVEKLENFTTWHVVGKEPLISAMIDSIWRVKSTIIIVTPVVEQKILEHLSQAAYKKKNVRFFYTTNWDLQTWGSVIEKMKSLGNIQFRNLKGTGEFYALSRDAEEVILGPNAKEIKDMVSIVSIQEGYCQLYSSFIGPIFQANSRPL